MSSGDGGTYNVNKSKHKYKHKSGALKRKVAEQEALKKAGSDPKQMKLSASLFKQKQVHVYVNFSIFLNNSRNRRSKS